MARKVATAESTTKAKTKAAAKPMAPDHLTMNLFAPGMSALHRAGLGGLACTLKRMEPQFDGEPPPWDIDEHSVTLRFGKPEEAAAFLKRLFAFAFSIRKDGLIYLPGQFNSEPSAAILADLQLGMTLTFLQHGRVRQLAKESTTASYDTDGDGLPGVMVEYRKCSSFKHQNGWEELVDKHGCLLMTPIRVDGPVSPGAVVRHVAYTGDTSAEDPPSRMLPLYFALVGCLPLPVNRGVAALLVPEVENLLDFQIDRPLMSPTSPKQCVIANAADGALQAQIRVKSHATTAGTMIPGCSAMTLRPTPWASQQKSRVASMQVPRADRSSLERFERSLVHLPPRIVGRTVKESTGKGKSKIVTEHTESFRTDSVVRPLVAENLALGRPWYQGFSVLMTKINPANDKPYRDQLTFERQGLNAMINDSKMWDKEDEEGQKLIVQAVHEAIRSRLGQIRKETDGKKPLSPATKNRWKRFRDKLRLDLAGSKTAAHVRFALADLFSRGGKNAVLRVGWEKVLPVLRQDWQLARDLGLLALASYSGKGTPGEPDSTPSAS